MAEKYLTDTDLAKRFQITRNSVWRWHRQLPDFPRVIRLTPGCSRWKLSEIETWEESRVSPHEAIQQLLET